MTIWLAAEIALLLAVIPCGVLILRSGDISNWAVALLMAGTIVVLALWVLAEAMHRPSFYDLAIALALLDFPVGLMFAHFLERWFR